MCYACELGCRSKVRCLCQSLPKSLTEPGACCHGWMARELRSACLCLNEVHSRAWLFTWALEIWTQILIRAGQTLHPSPPFAELSDGHLTSCPCSRPWDLLEFPLFSLFLLFFFFYQKLGEWTETVVARTLSWKKCGHTYLILPSAKWSWDSPDLYSGNKKKKKKPLKMCYQEIFILYKGINLFNAKMHSWDI